MIVAQTERLTLRRLTTADAGFMLEVLNDPSFVRYIGDRGVRTLEQSRDYLLTGPLESYARHGYGLYLVQLRNSEVPVGLCGLVKRDYLPGTDIGLSFLPAFWSKGYALEAALAIKKHARSDVGLAQLLAITSQDNAASIALLKKLGFGFERLIKAPGEAVEINLFTVELG